jgi:FAD:protein FMN transferase
MQRMEFRAMGSRILALVDRDDRPVRGTLDLVPDWFEEWEAAFSRFRPESELSRLNRSARRELEVSPAMGAVLREAVGAARETDGLADPLLLDALEAAGYDRSFDPANPPAGTSRPARIDAKPDWRAIQIDRSGMKIELPDGGKLDLGGIAKGWAADTAAARLTRAGPALVDAGGDISTPGPMADGSPWPVGVANPFSYGDVLCTIALWDGGVATSGRDFRRWISGGRPLHHIIDPRTGRPAETDVLTATVIASNACHAEAAAKAALILGSECGIDWLDRHPDLAGMLVLENKRIVYSRRFSDYVWN